MFATIFFCVVLVLLSASYYYNKKGVLPPLAGGALPIVGHAWVGFVKKERLFDLCLEAVLRPSLERNEETVSLRAGAWKVFLCMDPDDGYLLLNSCLKKDALYSFFNPWFGGDEGLITADVPTWKIHRKLLNPTMNQSVLDTYLKEFNEQSRQLVKLLNQEVGKVYFDPLRCLKQIMLQIVCATLMGVSVEDDKDLIREYGEAAEILSSCMIERIIKFCYHSDFIFNLSNLKVKQDAAAYGAQSLTHKVIRNKKEKMSGREDKGTDTPAPRFKSFLDLLLEMGKDGALSESEIQQEVNTFIGAAFDTTYHALGMTLLTIGSYPQVQQKIFDELQAVFEGSTRDVERQDISQLKYLEAFIKETLRLYPPVVVVGRTLDKDLKLKKYTLPAGSRCLMSIYHVGRHSMWGADAAQFRPERWLDGSLPTNTKTYAVFGLGRRNCIGSNFAMMVMKTVLCHVVRRYRISGDVTQLVLNLDVVMTPVSGHHICLERREE